MVLETYPHSKLRYVFSLPVHQGHTIASSSPTAIHRPVILYNTQSSMQQKLLWFPTPTLGTVHTAVPRLTLCICVHVLHSQILWSNWTRMDSQPRSAVTRLANSWWVARLKMLFEWKQWNGTSGVLCLEHLCRRHRKNADRWESYCIDSGAYKEGPWAPAATSPQDYSDSKVLLSWCSFSLFSYTTHDHLPGNGTTHSGLGLCKINEQARK